MVYDDDPPGPLGAIEDERLRLIFTCCHPAPPRPAGVAPANPDRTPCKSGCRPRWNTRRGPEAGEHRRSGQVHGRASAVAVAHNGGTPRPRPEARSRTGLRAVMPRHRAASGRPSGQIRGSQFLALGAADGRGWRPSSSFKIARRGACQGVSGRRGILVTEGLWPRTAGRADAQACWWRGWLAHCGRLEASEAADRG